jgi:ATP-dependent RNA helicase DeaD
VAVYGKADMQAQISTIGRGIDIIVATPGRLIDLLERGVVKMNQMQVLCLDEAD